MKTKKAVSAPVPPKHTQFQKGQSGNPRGRPKGSRNLGGLLKEALEAQAETKDGTQMTKLEAAVKKIADSAADGEPRMLQMLLAELRRLEPPKPAEDHDCMAVMRVYMKDANERLIRKLGKLRESMGLPADID